MRIYPDFTVGEYLFFPDRNSLFDGVDDVAAGVEGVCPVGGGHANQNGNFADVQRAGPVNDNSA